MDLSGIVVPMATPIDQEQHRIDETALRQFTEWLVDAGVHGLFPGGSIGEFPSMTREQNRTIIKSVAATADDDATVLAGCCGTSVDSVVELVDSAATAGADAAVIVAPYYFDTTQDGLKRFFEQVANVSPLPLLLYNIPSMTGNEIAVETVISLADHEKIIGLKDSSRDLTYHYKVISRTPGEFSVLQGATEMAVASLDIGADGLICGPSNVFPSEMRRLYDAYQADEHETVSQLMQDLVTPLVSATSDVPTAAGLKYLLSLHGRNIGGVLPPLPDLTASECEELDVCYRTIMERLEEGPIEH